MEPSYEGLLREWLFALRVRSLSHELAEDYFNSVNRRLGVPVVIVTTVVGTAVFSTLSDAPNLIARVAVGFLSLSAAILASLQTFLGYSVLAQKHKIASDRYSKLRRELEVHLARPIPSDVERQREFTVPFRRRWSVIDNNSLGVPPPMQLRARKSIGELTTRSASPPVRD